MRTYLIGERPIKLINKLSWGVGDCGAGYVDTMVSTFFLFFLTTVVGMDPALSGIALAASKFWDAVTDPLMGYISDHTISRHGRRNVYILFGAVPSGIMLFLMFHHVNFESPMVSFIYYLLIYCLHSTIWTIVNVPYNTINTEMTNDYATRVVMTGIRAPFSRWAAFAVSYIVPLVIYNATSLAVGFRIVAGTSAVFYAVCWLLVYAGTWNRTLEEDEIRRIKSDRLTLKTVFGEFSSVFRNKHMLMHLAVTVSCYVSIYIYSSFLMYFVTLHLRPTSNLSLVTSAASLGCAIAAFFMGSIIGKVGNGSANVVCTLLWGVGITVATFIPVEAPWYLSFIPLFIAGIGMVCIMLVPYQLLPFSIDADYIICGKHREGAYTGMMNLLLKCLSAAVMAILGVVLGFVGYVSGSETQTPEAVNGILQIMRWLPLISVLPGFFVSLRYKVNKPYHTKILSAIKKLENGVKPGDLPEDEARICEEFTGWKRHDLWRHDNVVTSKK